MIAPIATNRGSRRASVLLGVFAIVIAASLLAVTLLGAARHSAFHSHASVEAAEARTLGAAAAVRLVAAFQDRRPAMLEGEAPEIERSFTLWEEPGGRRAIARLVPVRPGEPTPIALNALIDANQADESTLAALDLLDDDLAEAIVAERERAPFLALADLTRSEGIDAALVFGEIDPRLETLDADRPAAQLGMPAIDGTADRQPEHLSEVLTVFAFEPNVMAGLSGEPDDTGAERLPVNAERDDEELLRIRNRYGREIADALNDITAGDEPIDTDADLVRALAGTSLPREQWGPFLDIFTTTESAFLTGRIDLNRAPAAAIRTLPGITDELTQQIIATRESLTDAERASPVWLLEQDLVSPARYAALADRLTARSLQWKLRVEVGLENPADGDRPIGIAPAPAARTGDLDSIELAGRRVYEFVIDAAGDRVRIASFTDITNLAGSLRFAELAAEAAGSAPPDNGPPSDRAASQTTPDADESPFRAVGVPEPPSPSDRRARFLDRLDERRQADRPDQDPSGSNAESDSASRNETGPPPDPRLGRWTSPRR